MMSSRMAATRAMWDLIKLAAQEGSEKNKNKIFFRSYGKMKLKKIPRSTYNKKLKKFEKFGLIRKIQTNNGHVFVITKKAKFLRSRPITKIRRTDEFATLIIFDIPEEKHNTRDTLRRYLIRNGYTQMRESCFISPFKVSQDLKDLVQELNLIQNISFFAAKVEYYF